MTEAVGEVKEVMESAVKWTASLVAGFAAVTTASLKAVESDAKFAESMGETYEAYQELDFAIKSVGGSSDDLRSSMDSLTNSLNPTKIGEMDQELLYFLGDLAQMDGAALKSSEALEKLSGKFSEVSAGQAINMGKKLGLSPKMIELLRKGPEGLAQLRKEANMMGAIVDSENLQDVEDINRGIRELLTVVVKLTQQLASELAPEIVPVIRSMKEWMITNKDLIRTKIGEFARGVARGFREFYESALPLINVVKSLLGYMGLLAGEMGTTETVAFAVKAALTLLAVSGVAMLAGKVIALGKTFFGLYKAMKNVAVMTTLKTWLVALKGKLIAVGVALKSAILPVTAVIATAFAAWNLGKLIADIPVVKKALDWFSDKVADLIGPDTSASANDLRRAKFLAKQGKYSTEEEALEAIKKADLAAQKRKKRGAGRGKKGLQSSFTTSAGAPKSYSPGAAPMGGVNQTITNTNQITVSGAGDPNAVAQAVVNKSNEALKASLIRPGVRAQTFS